MTIPARRSAIILPLAIFAFAQWRLVSGVTPWIMAAWAIASISLAILVLPGLTWAGRPTAAVAGGDVGPVTRALGGLALIACALGYGRWTRRAIGDYDARDMVYWLLAITLSGSAALAAGRPAMPRPGVTLLHGAVLLITGVAAWLRFSRLDRFPWVYNADEAKFGLLARQVHKGVSLDPFVTNFDAHPTLLIYPQAWFMALMGNDVAASRAWSALLGVVTVPVVYAYVRRIADSWTGVVAATLTCVFHFDIFLSRNAQNNITAVLGAALVLWALDLMRVHGNPVFAWGTGALLGLVQYGYVGNRLLIPLVGAVLIAGIAQTRAYRRGAVQAIWVLAGFITAYLPMLAFLQREPETYFGRMTIVAGSQGWLDDGMAETTRQRITIYADRFLDAVVLPFSTGFGTFFRLDAPWIGWTWTLFAAVGLSVILVRWSVPGMMPLAMLILGIGLSVTMMEGAIQASRLSVLGLILPIAAAIGVVGLAQAITGSHVVRTTLTVTLVAVLGWTSVVTAFDESDPTRTTDVPTIKANDLAYMLVTFDDGRPLILLDEHLLRWGTHPNIAFVAGARTVHEVPADTPFVAATLPASGPLLVAIPAERLDQLPAIQQRYPGGRLVEHDLPDGSPLIVYWIVDQAGGVPSADSPGPP